MTEGPIVEVEALAARQRLAPFLLVVWAPAMLALLADGYDLQAAAFAGPSLVRDWGIARSALAPMFTAGVVGLLVGAPLLGSAADYIGRKTAIILSLLFAGIFSLACSTADSVQTLMVYRFLTGVGIAGLLPNVAALTAELAPSRLRAPMIIIMFMGVAVGGALPGAIAAWLVPTHGWPVLFQIGGVAPLVAAAVMALAMPESIRFMALRGRSPARIARAIRRLMPEADIPPGARFVARASEAPQRAPISRLFEGRYAIVTPLLWLMFASILMTNYFMTSWMPVVFEQAGLSPAAAAWVNASFQLGGAVGGVATSLLIGRLGIVLVAGLFALAIPVVAMVGTPDLTTAGVAAAVASAGFCIIGTQFCMNASAGLAYPTAYRGMGAGMVFGVGRIGSLLGPAAGGYLIAQEVGTRALFLAPAIPLTIGLLAAVALALKGGLRWADDDA